MIVAELIVVKLWTLKLKDVSESAKMKAFFVLFSLLLIHTSNQQEVFGPCDVNFSVTPHPVASLCNFYIFCLNTVAYVFECEEGKIFVPELDVDPPYGECKEGKNLKFRNFLK